MMENIRKSEFKKLARTARARLKSGFWENQLQLRSEKFIALEEPDAQEKIIKQYFSASKFVSMAKSEDELVDEKLYPLVCRIIDEDDGLNPIGRLIDREKYVKMDGLEKQRYVFDLSERYSRLSQKYMRECEAEKRLRKLTRI